MEQNSNNSQNDFLWTLLAHPADDGGMYAYNLQRLVNDFPQSGILQALFAHISDEKNLKRASVYFNPRSLFKLINSPSAFAEVPEDRIYSQTAVSSNGSYQHNRTLFNEQLAQRPEEIAENIDDEQPIVDDHLLTDTEPAITAYPFGPETAIVHEREVEHPVEAAIQHDDEGRDHVPEFNEEIVSVAEEQVEDTIQHDHEHQHPIAELVEEINPVMEDHDEVVIHHHAPESEDTIPEVEEHTEDIIHGQEVYHHETESKGANSINDEHLEDITHDDEIHHHMPENGEVNPVTEEQVEDVVHDHEIYHTSENGEEVTPIVAEPVVNEHGHEIVRPADVEMNVDVKNEYVELPAHGQEADQAHPVEETPGNRDEPVTFIEGAEDFNHTADLPQPVIDEHTPVEPQALIEEDIDETFDEIVGIEDIDFSNPVNDKQAEEDNFFYAEQEEEYDAGEEEGNEQPVLPISNAEDIAPDVNVQQDVSMYHDEKMPYTFMWWLDKTRKEHAANNQPYIKPPVDTKPDKKIKKGTDELQQQYYENIFHITSVEDLDKNTPPPKVPYNMKRKEQVIIERFIKEEPQIKPQSSDKLDNENKAKKSSEDFDELVTETLAGIYSDQMLYHKAVASYKKLLLKYPEKSSYFAEKIEQLEKKIK